MPPRSLNGWTEWFLSQGHTYGDAELLAKRCLAEQAARRDPMALQLFQDPGQARDASIPLQDEAGVARPQRQPRPAPAPGYDPRTSDWPGDF